MNTLFDLNPVFCRGTSEGAQLDVTVVPETYDIMVPLSTPL